MILKHADDKQGDIDALHNLAAQATSVRQRALVQAEIDNIVAGIRGEQDAAYYLDQEFRHRDDAVVIHDLRIEEDGDVAQMDHVVISRRRQAFVLETKALKAKLNCNAAGEWEAVYGRGTRHAIPSPVEQCKRHAAVLRRWLGRRETSIREVIPLVLIAPTTQIASRHTQIDDPEIVKSDLFPRWYDQKSAGSGNQVVQRGSEVMTEDEIVGIGYRIMRAHTPAQFDWRKRFGFPSLPQGDISKDAVLPLSGGHAAPETPATAVAPSPSPYPVAPDPAKSAQPAPAQTADMFRDTGQAGRNRYEGKTDVEVVGGTITIYRYPDDTRGIRCTHDRQLGDRVAEQSRKVGARWAPAAKMWMMPFDRCKQVVAALKQPAQGGLATDMSQQELRDAERSAVQRKRRNEGATYIETRYGRIDARPLPDGRVALRHARSAELEEAVAGICRGRAQWNPRYSNWIIQVNMMEEVRERLSVGAVR